MKTTKRHYFDQKVGFPVEQRLLIVHMWSLVFLNMHFHGKNSLF